MLIWFLVAIASEVVGPPSPSVVEAAITHADTYEPLPWTWNGRNTDALPGIDCMGLVFRAYGSATSTSWRTYATDPSKLVASAKLGAPVPGLDGVLRDDFDPKLLKRGDVVYFLRAGYKIADDPLLAKDGSEYWPWHMGIYVDEGKQLVLNAHPSFDVVRMPVEDVRWDALFVTRPGSP